MATAPDIHDFKPMFYKAEAHFLAFSSFTYFDFSSVLFAIITKGTSSGTSGFAWSRNSFLQDSRDLKLDKRDTSKTKTTQSTPR